MTVPQRFDFCVWSRKYRQPYDSLTDKANENRFWRRHRSWAISQTAKTKIVYKGMDGLINVSNPSSTTTSSLYSSDASCENGNHCSVACAFEFADQIKLMRTSPARSLKVCKQQLRHLSRSLTTCSRVTTVHKGRASGPQKCKQGSNAPAYPHDALLHKIPI